MKRKIREMLLAGHKFHEIVDTVGCSKATISYHAKILGLSRCHIKKYDWKKISEKYNEGLTVKECKVLFGFSSGAWGTAVKRGDVTPRSPFLTNEYVTSQKREFSAPILNRVLLTSGKEYKCELCGIREWNNLPLALRVDHIDGVNLNNRIDNLRFLCPNCHTQTPTWGSKNIKNPARLASRTDVPETSNFGANPKPGTI